MPNHSDPTLANVNTHTKGVKANTYDVIVIANTLKVTTINFSASFSDKKFAFCPKKK